MTVTVLNLDHFATDPLTSPLLEALMAPGDPGGETLGQLLRRAHPAWHQQAACVDAPGVNFFPGHGEPSAPAIAVCSRCDVQPDCLTWAATNSPSTLSGIWGGSTGRDRKRYAGDPVALAAAVAPRLDAIRQPSPADVSDCEDCGRPKNGWKGRRCGSCARRLQGARGRLITSARAACVECGSGEHALDDRHRCPRCAARAARIAAEDG